MAAEATLWLRVAERDLKAVRNNVYGPDPTTEITVYRCQQAADAERYPRVARRARESESGDRGGNRD